MKPTTVQLPDTLDSILRREAGIRGVTIAAVAREAAGAYLKVTTPRQLLAAGAGNSGVGDISDRIEEILAAEITR
jgi:hypothetical protein